MKKIILLLAISFSLLFGNKMQIFAASPTPTPSIIPSPQPTSASATVIEKLKKIEVLKEKIATKVAELRENEKGAIFGAVKKIDKSNITLENTRGDQVVAYSEDTVVYSFKSGSRQEIKVSTLKEKDPVTIFGYYDQSKTNFSAKYIYLENLPLHIRGKVSDIDKSNFAITVKEKEGNVIVDVETSTKTSLYDRNKKAFAAAGFSKIKVGDTVHIIAATNPKTPDRVSAKKLYVISFPNQPTAAVISPTPKPSTPSATVTGKSSK